MKRYSELLLNELLHRYERSSLYNGENIKKIKIVFKFTKKAIPDYFHEYKAEYKEEINEVCLGLMNKGYIEIYWKKFQENNIIEKIALNVDKVDEIYKELKKTPKKSFAAETVKILNQYSGYSNWLGSFARDMKAKIEANQSVKKYIDIEDSQTITEIMYALAQIITQETEIPKRVFSVKHFNDSKKIEKLETKLVRIMLDFGGYSRDVDVLAEANIIKNPGYVYLKGVGVFGCNGETIDLERLNGEIGLSSAIIDSLQIKTIDAQRIITIENLTTFHTYIPNHELIIYLGGYHNSIRRKFLVKLYHAAKDTPFYHWGDIDLGGLRILNHLRKKTEIPFKPLFMDKETLRKNSNYLKEIEDKRYIKNLKKMLEDKDYEEFYEVIEYMIEKRVRLEQEAIDSFT